MSRLYQEIGLTKEAKIFLEENIDKVIKTVHKDYFYGDGPNLCTILLKDGRVAQEFVQEAPWSSGPVAFFGLMIFSNMVDWASRDEEPIFFEWKIDSDPDKGVDDWDYDKGIIYGMGPQS